MHRRGRALASVASAVVLGCAADSVAPDQGTEPECGNGIVESGEQCDVDSPGCVQCVVAPAWTCGATSCAPTCGDGVVGSSPSCADARRDSDCDMTGYWAARESDYTRDTVVSALQTSSTWMLYRFQQTGEAFEVVEQLECGVHVTGGVTVEGTSGTLRALLWQNRMDAKSPHGARRGTSKAVPGGCAITLDRWYKARGVSEAFLPANFADKPALAALPALPAVDDPVKATVFPPAAEDWDDNGFPGVAFRLSGFVHGVRDTVQRDWKEYATFPTAPAPAGALTFAVPGMFDLQEKVLHASDCGGVCALVVSLANPARDVVGRLTLTFIGKTFGSKRVSSVLAGAPRLDRETDLTTCARVRLLLPHDTSKPTPAPAPTGSGPP